MSHVNGGSSGSVPYHRLDLRWAGSCCLTQVRAGSLSALSIGCFSYRQRDECVEAKHKVWSEKCLEADASAGWLVEEQAAAACVGVLSVLFGHIQAWIRSKYVFCFKFQPTKHCVGETQANVMLHANTSILQEPNTSTSPSLKPVLQIQFRQSAEETLTLNRFFTGS